MRMNLLGSETQRYQSVLARAGQSSLRAGESSITPYKDSIGNLTPFMSSAQLEIRNKKEKHFLDLNEVVTEHPIDQE
jgi:hypothetical protein